MSTKIEKIAERILENKATIKKLKKEMEQDMELIREHVQDTGEMELGKAMAYERKNKPQFVGVRKSVNVDKATTALIDELPVEYKKFKTEVDLNKLLDDQSSNKELTKLFKKHGLRLEQDATIHIKHF